MREELRMRRFSVMKQRSHPQSPSAQENHLAALKAYTNEMSAHALEVEVAARWQNKTLEAILAALVQREKANAEPQQQAGGDDSADAEDAARELTDEDIDVIWRSMPGGPAGWIKSFGYQQFAREIEAAILDGADAADIAAAPTPGGAKG